MGNKCTLESGDICFFFQASLVVENNSSNAINWVSSLASFLWRFQFPFSEIKVLSVNPETCFIKIALF